MLRRTALARTSFAADRIARDIEEAELRPEGARRLAAAARLAAAPLLLAAAAVAGAVFVLLLPVCGIASIAEAVARWCWEEARGGVTHASRGIVPQD